jgi:tetratricopeptide (TPR) repeat protein
MRKYFHLDWISLISINSYSLETMELKQKLGKDFAAKLNIIEQEAETIWKKGELYHIYYTLHGLDHSNYVIKIIEKLIEGLNTEDILNETEIFCLLSAAYLHDVGMQCKNSDDIERAAKISELKKRTYTFQDLIRDEHHIRSGRYIKERANDLKLDHIEAECIRLISEGHRETKLESKEYDDQLIGLESVRVRLLSGLLRLADELDITYKRAPETLFEILKKDMPDYSRLQWLKHYYTSGISIITQQQANKKKKTSIVIQCQYPNEDVGRKITEILISKPIEDTLNDVRLILLEYGLNLNLDHKIKCNPDLTEIPENIYDKYLGQNLKISMELPRTKRFVGRNNELKDLLSSLDKNVIIIEGIAGIGKTYIAAKFAEELKDEYTVYWYGNLSEVSTLSSVVNKISIFLKENGKPTLSNSIEHFGYDNEVLIALLKEELNSNNFAIFFDDYHKAEKELNPLLKQLVSIKQSKIIVITRQDPEFYNVVDERESRVVKIKIEAWDFAHTKMMLEARGIGATDETLEKIHDLLHGYPQYLNLFCILAERSTAEKLLEKLPTAIKDAHEYLEKEVYDSLTSDEKLLLQTIAVFRVPEIIDAFDNVNKFKHLNETLDNLIHKFLVNEIGINTFSVHDILRDYYLSDVSRKKILRSYHERAAEYYLSLDDDPEHVLEAAYHFDDAGIIEKSAEVIINNARDFISKGFWKKIEDQLQNAIKSFQRKTQPLFIQLVARAHLEIGSLYLRREDLELALHHGTSSRNFFKKINDTEGIFNSNNLLAGIYYKKNETEEAKKYNEKCLKMVESEKNAYHKAVAFGTYALLLGDDDKEQELDYYMKSLRIFEEEMDSTNTAIICYNIAGVYEKIGNYEKAYEFIKRALELHKEKKAIFDVARTKSRIAEIYYNDPKKQVDTETIVKCLKEEVLEVYEKIGHVRGTAEVLIKIGDIYNKEKDLKSAITYYQKVAPTYNSLNQKSEEAKLNSIIGTCYVKLKDFPKAKLYFEKNLASGYSSFVDKLSLAEVYLIIGSFNEAYTLLKATETEEGLDDKRYVLPFFISVSLMLLNKVNDAYTHLKKIGNIKQKLTINWDFSDIEPVMDKTGESKQFFIDAITLLKGETNYPIIRLKDVKTLSEELGKQAEVLHPFTGSLIITKDNENLIEIMKKLIQGKEIDFDTPEIMGIERNNALLVLGFLFKKGFLDCKNLDKQKHDLKLTERGLKILRLREAG